MSELPIKNGAKTVRDTKGRFVPGGRGGPGRPRSEFSITEMLRTTVHNRPALVARLTELCESEDERVALEAIKVLLNRLEPLPKDGGAATAIASATVIVRNNVPELGV